MPFLDPEVHKDDLGLAGRKVILTFGLLSPNKGIEHMIRAMPAVIRRHPDAIYVVLGVTHPGLKAERGEEYRQGLYHQVREMGLESARHLPQPVRQPGGTRLVPDGGRRLRHALSRTSRR